MKSSLHNGAQIRGGPASSKFEEEGLYPKYLPLLQQIYTVNWLVR